MDLDIPDGARIGVVGQSGSGKTTLAGLLLRFLDPDAGRVTLAGTDLRELTLDRVRSRIGLVDDDPHVFASSVVENVRLARPEATDAEIRTALDTAQLGPWVDGLPYGQDTLIGEGNAAVSGGERARLGLARIVLADPAIVVLDEPTAHLDDDTANRLAADLLGAPDHGLDHPLHGGLGSGRSGADPQASTTIGMIIGRRRWVRLIQRPTTRRTVC